MPSSKYALFEQAMRTGKQVVCVYKGLPREVCPIILGHSQGKEKLSIWWSQQPRVAGSRRVALPVSGRSQ
jgi:hypothetical protein